MWKACSRCGKIHAAGHKCYEGITYGGGEERKLRNKYAWAKKSKQMRSDALFCEVCKDEGVYTYNNLEVHHIEKLRNAPEKLLDDDNLIVLCTYHHKLADRGELSRKYLESLVERREQNTPLP